MSCLQREMATSHLYVFILFELGILRAGWCCAEFMRNLISLIYGPYNNDPMVYPLSHKNNFTIDQPHPVALRSIG